MRCEGLCQAVFVKLSIRVGSELCQSLFIVGAIALVLEVHITNKICMNTPNHKVLYGGKLCTQIEAIEYNAHDCHIK